MNLVLCVPVGSILRRKYDEYQQGLTLDRVTLLQLEKATDRGLKDILDDIFLVYQNKKIRIDYQPLDENLVQNRNFSSLNPMLSAYHSSCGSEVPVTAVNLKTGAQV